MPGPDTAVEEAPVLAGLYLALEFLLLWMMYRALKGVWRLVFSPVLETLAGALKINVWRVHIDAGGVLRDLDHRVINFLGEQALASEQAMGYWFHQAARLQMWIVNEMWDAARDSLHFGSWLVHSFIPARIHDATHPLGRTVHTVTHTVSRVERIVVHTPAVAKAAAHAAVVPLYRTVAIPHLGELQWIHRHWKALTRAAAVAGSAALAPALTIPRLWRGIDDAESDIRKLSRRVHRTEALFGATAMAAAMANVLGLRNPRCLRSGPLGKVARLLCGVPSNLLNDVLGLLADFFILENICTVLPWLETAASDIGTPLVELLTDVGAGLCAGATPSGALRGPMPSVPAVIFGRTASGV